MLGGVCSLVSSMYIKMGGRLGGMDNKSGLG